MMECRVGGEQAKSVGRQSTIRRARAEREKRTNEVRAKARVVYRMTIPSEAGAPMVEKS
jgi:hypothetical protein